MIIKYGARGISVGGETIPFREFPCLYGKFLGATNETREIEKEGAALMKARRFGDKRAYCFVLSILKWGGPTGAQIRGNLHRYYRGGEAKIQSGLAQAVRDTVHSLKTGSCADAIQTITSHKGFQTPYGSKVLRMLAPERAVVYDNVLNRKMKLGWGRFAYGEFCDSCVLLAGELNKRKIGTRRWKAADVEAVIYARVKGF